MQVGEYKCPFLNFNQPVCILMSGYVWTPSVISNILKQDKLAKWFLQSQVD